MDFEGKTCGVCDKGKLRGFKDEVEKGIFVSAYKCSQCSEVAYSREVMQKVEVIYRDKSEERSLIKIGASLAVSIPAGIVKALGLKPKEKVYLTRRGNELIARFAQM